MRKFYVLFYLIPVLLTAKICLYSHFDSMPPLESDTAYSLDSYNWQPSVSTDTLSPIFITLHEEFSPLNSDNRYYTMSHGKYSLIIEDTLSDTFAYATHEFPYLPRGLSEYMVEFYIWVNKMEGRFYLYQPLFNGEDLGCYIALTHHSIEGSNENMVFEVRYGDAVYNYEYSKNIPRLYGVYFPWHKIQLHHHNNGRITLWIDGDSIMSNVYQDAYNPTDFLIGTIDTLSNGEVFFDDFIITTPPDGEHPRLWFDSSELEDLRDRINDTDTLPIGLSYEELFDRIENIASLDNQLYYKTPPSYTNGEKLNAKGSSYIFKTIMLQDTMPSKIARTAPNWYMWAMQNQPGKYATLQLAGLTFFYETFYDFFFNELSPYDRINIQNALLVNGVNQLYIQLYHILPHPVNYYGRYLGPTGLFGLVVDDSKLSAKYINKVRNEGFELLSNNSLYHERIDPIGGIAHEGTVYSDATFTPPLVFFAALSRQEPDIWENDSFNIIRNASKGLAHLLIPETPAEDPRTSNFVSFGDVGGCGCSSINCLFFLSHFFKDSLSQWILKRSNTEIIRYLNSYHFTFFPVMEFLYADKNVPAIRTDTLESLYFPRNGWYTIRTGWDSIDVLVATTRGFCGSHQQNTGNHFVIGWKNYWIIPDHENTQSGYGSPHAVLHNTLLNVEAEGMIDYHNWWRGKLLKRTYNESFGLFEGFIDGSDPNNLYYAGDWIRKGFLLNEKKAFLLYDYAIHNPATPIEWTYRLRKLSNIGYGYSDNDSVKLVIPPSYNDTFAIKFLYPLNKIVNFGYSTISLKYDPPEQKEVEFINVFYPKSLVKPKIERVYSTNSKGTKIDNYIVAFSEKTDTSRFSEYKYKNRPTESTIHILPDLLPETEYYYVIRDDLDLIDKRSDFTDTIGLLKFPLEQIDYEPIDSITIGVSIDTTPPEIFYNPLFYLWGKKLASCGRYPNLFTTSDDLSGWLYYNVYYSSGYGFDTLMRNVREGPYFFTFPEIDLSDVNLKVQVFDRMFNPDDSILEDIISIGPLFCTKNGSFKGNNQRKTGFSFSGEIFNLAYEVNKSIILSDSTNDWRNRFIDYGSSPALYIYDDTEYILYLHMDKADTIKMASVNLDSIIDIASINLEGVINPDFNRYLEPPSFFIQNDTAYTLIGAHGWKRLGQQLYIEDYDVIFGRIPLCNTQNSIWENKAHYEKGNLPAIDTSSHTPSIINDDEENIYIVWSSPSFVDTQDIYGQYRDRNGWSEIFNVSSSPDIPSHSPYIDYYPYNIDVVWVEGDEVVRRTFAIREGLGEIEVIGEGMSPQIVHGNFATYERDEYVMMAEYDGFEWKETDKVTGDSPHLALKSKDDISLSYVKPIENGWKIETESIRAPSWRKIDDQGLAGYNQNKMTYDGDLFHIFYTDSSYVFRIDSRDGINYGRSKKIDIGQFPSGAGSDFVYRRDSLIIFNDSVGILTIPSEYKISPPVMIKEQYTHYVTTLLEKIDSCGSSYNYYYKLLLGKFIDPAIPKWDTLYSRMWSFPYIPGWLSMCLSPDIEVRDSVLYIVFDCPEGALLYTNYFGNDSILDISNGSSPSLSFTNNYLNIVWTDKDSIFLKRFNTETGITGSRVYVSEGLYPVITGDNDVFFIEGLNMKHAHFTGLRKDWGIRTIDSVNSLPSVAYINNNIYIAYNRSGLIKTEVLVPSRISILSGNYVEPENSVVFATGDIIIHENDTVIIPPNTNMLFSSFSDRVAGNNPLLPEVVVDGVLIAEGVTFSAVDSIWGGLLISGRAELENIHILDANIGILVNSGEIKLNKSKISGCGTGLEINIENEGEIRLTEFNGCETGIYSASDSVCIEGCRINNSNNGIILSGNTVITGNIFNQCDIDLSIEDRSPVLGDVDEGIGGCNVFTGESLFIKNLSSFDIKAEGNYWNGLTSDGIEEKILDFCDDSTYGRIDYTPVSNYGEIDNDTILSGNIFVTGNLIIPENRQVVIHPYTKFKILNKFNTNGVDSLIEIHVKGTIIPGPFTSFKPIVQTEGIEWKGLSLRNDHTIHPLEKIEISNAFYGIKTNNELKLMFSEINNCYYGIYVDSSGNGIFIGDSLINNGIGLYFKGSGNVKWSRIENNETGVYIDDAAEVSLGDANGMNIIINEIWSVYNNTPDTIYAKRNYWGTDQIGIIEAKIFDYCDDSTKGKVVIEPIKTSGKSSSSDRSDIPETLSLISIYPIINKGALTALVAVPEKTSLTFKIFDIVGRNVKNYTKDIETPGFYNIRIKLDFPSGVYYIGLKNDEDKKYKKLIVIR